LEDRTLLSAGDLDPTFGNRGKVTTAFGTGVAVLQAVVVQADGRIVAVGASSRTNGNRFGLARYNSDGNLDTSFGGSGLVTTDFSGGDDKATSAAIQADGRIIAAGYTDHRDGSSVQFALARYNANGSLDRSFGTAGRVTTPFGGVDARVTGVAVQADGRIVAAGFTRTAPGGAVQFAVARYDSDGTLDTSFGTGGKVTTSFGGTDDEAAGVAVQADGRIVAAGFTDAGGSPTFAVARYTSTGSLDASFGSSGKVTTSFGGVDDRAAGVVVQADGRIVAAGFTRMAIGGSSRFALARYNTTGSQDTSFGSSGLVTTSFGGVNDQAAGVTLQADGRIVAAGTAGTSSRPFVGVARYTTSGSLDTSFGGSGEVITGFNHGYSVAVQSDGRIVAAGSFTQSSTRFALARFTRDGLVDDPFGTFGQVFTDFPTIAIAYGMAIQSDGRIIITGSTYLGLSASFGLARYNSDGSLDTSFGGSGLVSTSFGVRNVTATSVAVQSDGRIVVAGYTYNSTSDSQFALARYNSDGSPDTSFGTAGHVTATFGGTYEQASSVVVQSDGRIVVGGFTNAGGISQFALARYTSDGNPDATFGTAGQVTTDFHSVNTGISSLAVQADGRIVAAGFALLAGHDEFALARYNTNGSLDSSFGTSGLLTAAFGGIDTNARAYSMAVQPDGGILAGGYSVFARRSQFALARFNSNGSADRSFGTAGQVTTSLGGNADTVYSVAVQANGRIIAAGVSGNGGVGATTLFGLARYQSNGSLDTSFGTGGLVTTSFGGNSNVGRSVAVQSDGQIVVAGFAMLAFQSPDVFALARYDGGGVASQTTLISSGSPSVYGQSVTFTASVTNGGQPVTAGSVTFSDGSTVLGSVNVDGSGHATYTTTRLTAAGSPHNLTATYDGGGGGGPSSGAFQQMVTPAPLTINADDQTKVAGDPVPTLTASYSGFVNGDTPDSLTTPVSLSTYSGDTAGTYPIVPSGATSPNYSITFVNGTLTVNPAAAVALQVNAPVAVTAGQPFDFTVSAVDPYGNVDTSYVGSFHLGIFPEAPDLGISAFTPADHGVVGFAGFGLYQAGVQTIVASGELYGQADLTVNPGAAVALVLSGPSNATAGVPFSVTVTAYDAWGNIATGYAGTVAFSSDEPAAGLPPDYAFQPGDQGTQTFQVTLFTPGTHRVSVTDTLDPSLSSDLFVTL
jgi:uncharacterized delta-60 repeat protein